MNENKDRGSLIIKIVAIVLIVAAVIGIILFMVFNKPQPHKDLDTAYAGKYELTEVSGLSDKHGNVITPSSYEYNYILLGEDGRYEIANKYNGKKTSQKGVWYVKDGYVIFESSRMWGLVKTEDKGKIANNTITMSMDSNGVLITMVLTRKAQ